jgi:hypothetical protein
LPVRWTRWPPTSTVLVSRLTTRSPVWDHRLGVALGTAHDGMDTGDQFVFVEGLGHVIVGADAESLRLRTPKDELSDCTTTNACD